MHHANEDDLVRWVERFRFSVAHDAAHLRLIVLDTLALGIGAHAAAGSSAARALQAAGQAFGIAEGSAIIWGTGARASAAVAAFANGCAAEEMDFQEVLIHGRNNGHAAVVIVPALLALAALRPGISGPRLLQAIATALEANLAILKSLGRSHRENGRGVRTTALGAPVAAALAGAWLLDLDQAAMRAALCHAAAALPAGLLASMAPENGSFTADKDTAVGLSAMHAVLAVLLAAAGVSASARALTGARGLLATFGHDTLAPFELPPDQAANLHRYELKRFAANFGAQSAIAATARLRERATAAAIDRLVVRIKTSSATSLSTRAIVNPLAARFSLPYALAVTWDRGLPEPSAFEAPVIFDPQVLARMDRVELVPDEALEARHRSEGLFPAVVTAVLKDGSSATQAVDGPWDGLSERQREEAILAKSRRLMAASGEDEAVIKAVMDLPAAGDLSDLWRALRRGARD